MPRLGDRASRAGSVFGRKRSLTTLAQGFAFGRGMELLFLITVLAFVALYVAYREWLNATHKRWVMELDLFKKRLATYEELKSPWRRCGRGAKFRKATLTASQGQWRTCGFCSTRSWSLLSAASMARS
jgi:hypothetical protein